MFGMVGQDYAITNVVKHGGGRDNALKYVSHSVHGRENVERTPSLSD
jgi:hypothetical protein